MTALYYRIIYKQQDIKKKKYFIDSVLKSILLHLNVPKSILAIYFFIVILYLGYYNGMCDAINQDFFYFYEDENSLDFLLLLLGLSFGVFIDGLNY